MLKMQGLYGIYTYFHIVEYIIKIHNHKEIVKRALPKERKRDRGRERERERGRQSVNYLSCTASSTSSVTPKQSASTAGGS